MQELFLVFIKTMSFKNVEKSLSIIQKKKNY